MKKIGLILFSGGIDSTYVLAQKLRETDDTIIAHHVHMVNFENRHKAEAEACRAIVDYCQTNYRDFQYSETLVNRSTMKTPGFDVLTVSFEAGIVSSNIMIQLGRVPDYWTMGLNKEEYEEVSDVSAGRLDHMIAACAAGCFPNKPPEYVRPVIQPKRELIEYMGPELSQLCWTCRKPVETENGFAECGKCKTCKLMKQVRDDIRNKA